MHIFLSTVTLAIVVTAQQHASCSDPNSTECEFFTKACPANAKLPAFCTDGSAKILTTAETEAGIFDTCDQMPEMKDCPLPAKPALYKYSRLCIDMPRMGSCKPWVNMCASIGKQSSFCGGIDPIPGSEPVEPKTSEPVDSQPTDPKTSDSKAVETKTTGASETKPPVTTFVSEVTESCDGEKSATASSVYLTATALPTVEVKASTYKEQNLNENGATSLGFKVVLSIAAIFVLI
ncbi:hypothetical protein HK099_001560 [Clydaea vesicula]|uniref:Secreted protein n=1 Tax=Clydaea vesicula TaxID=447962 RepID=A0AAD5Y170_9FUNG|nr:hypothetical protein HK099_001560 [Clydaea vesicula]